VQLTEVSSEESPPDVAAEQRELRDVVKRELMALPDEQREIILLRDYHNLSYAGVAQVLSIPVGTVMSRLHRARAELQRRLREYR
jgi:RNA polymerase sigma-70 factor (ECF subfamily)